MRTFLTTVSLLFIFSCALQAQSTYARVYEIMQEKCVQCHNNADPEQGLDLEGAGATLQAKMLDVYNNVVGVLPANSNAANAGLEYIYPGRADRSFIFHKINQGLEPTIELGADMGSPMPAYGGPTMNDVEKEMIRQWVLYGATYNGDHVNEDYIQQYYDGQGLASFPEVPAAPAPGEGFQIKMGPFYLSPAGEPGDELEFFQKWELFLDNELDVNRIDMQLSGYSHHFLMYNFTTVAAANNIPDGLRFESYHNDIGVVAAVQEATDLVLPEGTAFMWPNTQILDLNSHYINYSAGLVYQAEIYVNVYTQEAGNAEQQMYSDLLVNGNIPIPNNGNTTTHTQVYNPINGGEVYLWQLMGHTHKYGTGYKVYEWKDGAEGDLIYDGACAEGAPDCASPYFDYQHIPPRYFEPLRPLPLDFYNGLKHEATWVNDGPSSVNFGPTSDDEMMVLILMYTLDSVGINVSTATQEPSAVLDGVSVNPNPTQKELTVTLPLDLVGETRFQLYDINGQLLQDQKQQAIGAFQVNLELPSGMYFYQLTDESGRQATGKVQVIR